MKNIRLIRDIVIFVLFVAIIALPILNFNRISGKISENENRYLATFPKLTDEEGNIVLEGFKTGFESWLNDNIGFRDQLVELYGKIKLNVFHDSPNSQVEKGKDGWNFYTLVNNMDIAYGNYPLTEDDIKILADMQQRISDYYTSKGIEYVLILPPSKVSIYPEYIASGDFTYTETPVDMVSDYLEKNTTVKCISVKDDLIASKSEGQLYYKTDTHWNQRGAYVAYKSIIDGLKEFGITDGDYEEVDFVDSEYKGEFAAMMGNKDLLPPEKTEDTVIINKNAERTQDGELYNRLFGLKEQYNVNNPVYLYNNDSVKDRKMLFYGDSMFGSWNATELLAEHFSQFTFLWSYEMIPEYVDELQPDVVVYEITERFINTLPGRNHRFLMEGIDAKIEADNITSDAENYYITVENTGSVKWTETGEFKLGLLADGEDCSVRASMKENETVEPGGRYTFAIRKKDIPKNVSKVEAVMVQENVTYFGDTVRIGN